MALYLLFDPNICAEVVSEETLKSDLEEDNCNWQGGVGNILTRIQF